MNGRGGLTIRHASYSLTYALFLGWISKAKLTKTVHQLIIGRIQLE